MQRLLIIFIYILLVLPLSLTAGVFSPSLTGEGWQGAAGSPDGERPGSPSPTFLFDSGNYALFIHFGLYSKMEGEWKGRPYYGAAEWLMNHNQAGIPADEYMAEAATFCPDKFDADAIVQLAKDAGMKYIVITAKHHEGFAMFRSDVSTFSICDATPLHRDLMAELAAACHREGLGIGFYYSQFQDWTTPGGGNGPTTDATGRTVSFDEYFRTKCVPQVEELTTRYGDIQLIWFDTPGNMSPAYSQELVDIVRRNQPGALVSSRVGNGLGDYTTLGDMEVPLTNRPGRWEGIDVTQVGWGYSKFDNQWKSPDYIVRTLVSTIARGGTYMLNIGPRADGSVHPNAAASLRKAGEWVHRHPQVIYGADPSPWGQALPWGDAVVNDGKVYLIVFQWPQDGRLWVPTLGQPVTAARLSGTSHDKKLKLSRHGDWTLLTLPTNIAPDPLGTVIEIESLSSSRLPAAPRHPSPVREGDNTLERLASPTAGVISPSLTGEGCQGSVGSPDGERLIFICGTSPGFLFAERATAEGCAVKKFQWMTKFGEWNFKKSATDLTAASRLSWAVDVAEEGCYEVCIETTGEERAEWLVTTDEGQTLRNEQVTSNAYALHPLGWLRILTPGRHTLTLSPLSGDYAHTRVSALTLRRVM
ncbi:MAG: alpha-L-fucosidase [Bacteroidaceae bacterium]|nr:alpha-L-fucosidase [Bacteroidaceae bacterium]